MKFLFDNVCLNRHIYINILQHSMKDSKQGDIMVYFKVHFTFNRQNTSELHIHSQQPFDVFNQNLFSTSRDKR